MSAFFFAKNQLFLVRIVPLLKAVVCELCWRFFSFVFSFSQIKGYFYWNVSFTVCASGIRLVDCSILAINQKNDNDVTVSRHDVIVNFFYGFLFLLSSLVTGPSLMSISSLVLELWQFYFIRVDNKSRNWKYSRLSFVQYLKTGSS